MKNKLLKLTNNTSFLLTLFIIIIGLLISLGMVGANLNKKTLSQYEDIVGVSTSKLSLLINIRKNADYLQVTTLRYFIDTSLKDKDVVEKKLAAVQRTNDSDFVEYKKLISSTEEADLFNKVYAAQKINAKTRNMLLEKMHHTDISTMNPMDFHKTGQKYSYEILQNSITDLSGFLTSQTDSKIIDVINDTSHSRIYLRIAMLLIICLIMMLAYIIVITINKLKQKNKELKVSDNMYRSLFNNMLNGYAYCQMHYNENNEPIDWTYITVNGAFGKLTGLNDVMGKKVTDVIPGIYNSSKDLFILYSSVATTGEPLQFESYVKELDIWFSISVYSAKKGFFVVVFDTITERKNSEKRLKNLTEELRTFTVYLENAREEERKSIAKDIHDELGQNLTVSKMDLAWVIKHLDDDKNILKEKLEQLQHVMQGTIDTSRRLYNNLYPQMMEDIGLIGVIKWHASNYLKPKNIGFEFITSLPEDRVMDEHRICLVLFRIYQECSTNILRYSRASFVVIDFNIHNGHIVLSITDNGVGFDINKVDTKMHHGLLGMRERAFALNGILNIQSEIGKGTKLTVSIPVPQEMLDKL